MKISFFLEKFHFLVEVSLCLELPFCLSRSVFFAAVTMDLGVQLLQPLDWDTLSTPCRRTMHPESSRSETFSFLDKVTFRSSGSVACRQFVHNPTSDPMSRANYTCASILSIYLYLYILHIYIYSLDVYL